MPRKRSQRVIEHLRRQFPHLQWTYEWPSCWKASNGWEIQAYSQMGWTDDDWSTVYYLQRSDRVERWKATKDQKAMEQITVYGFPAHITASLMFTSETENPLSPSKEAPCPSSPAA